MTRLLIPLVAAVTLGLLVVWLLQRPAPVAPGAAAPNAAASIAVPATEPSEADAATPPDTAPDATEAPAEGADVAEEANGAPEGDQAVADGATEGDQAVADGDGPVADGEGPVADGEGPVADGEGPVGADAEVPPDAGDVDAVAPAGLAEALVPDGYAVVPALVADRRIAFEAAESVIDGDLDYAAVIETSRGVLVVELFASEAPATVNNFVFLARHLYYDGILFHRVIDGFMAQTGDPTGTGTGGPGYRFDDEIVAELRHDTPGVLSMANAGRGTNGSQFFLTFAPTPWLDGAHTVFGRVVEGLEVLDRITRVDPQEPSVVVLLADSAASVRDQGIDLPGDGTIGEALTALLGAAPVPGPGYDVAGARVAIGTVAGSPAAGFFPYPDRMERVTIVARPRG